MSVQIRDVVVSALHKATGILNDAEFGKIVIEGGDLPFAKIEIDSLSRFELIMHVEEALNLELDDDEITSRSSLNELITYLETVQKNRGS